VERSLRARERRLAGPARPAAGLRQLGRGRGVRGCSRRWSAWVRSCPGWSRGR